MELTAVQDSFERVAKRRKLSSSKSQDIIVQVAYEIEQALSRIRSSSDSTVADVDQGTVLAELKAKLHVVGSQACLEGSQQEVNATLSRHQKVLEKVLHPDISKACVDVDFDRHLMNQIIIRHFYSEDLSGIVDCLVKEAGEPEATSPRLQCQEIHHILEALKSRDLGPASKWISANRERLRESGSDLELKLHKMQFVDLLQGKGGADALKYARTYLAPLASRHMNVIQRLICSMLWAERLDRSPYADLADPSNWRSFGEEVVLAFRRLSGQSARDPLSMALAAGMEGLPTLLKLVDVMAANKQEWEAMKQLPVPLELGREFHFHSTFVCPVSRDQGSEENPPMLLPCGHVLCQQSIDKLSKAGTRDFKCPYCHHRASSSQCKHLCF
ncbi:protein RMD5 [Salvia divinorum]|uniref:Protein RMD5 n=1 Tax=Salvia divinorum TaxID=28513 RepID=A0ABD1FS05_SALDI